jgi:hypothetical protein
MSLDKVLSDPARHRLLLGFVVVVLFLGACLLQVQLDARPPASGEMEVYMYVPSGEFLKHFTLGFGQLMADYFWIKTISYFADHLLADRQYPWLYHILDLVTTLDPLFLSPYYFGGVILSLEANQVEQSTTLLTKAMRYHPDKWNFPFFIGFNYWYYCGSPAKAAPYLEIAARLPGAPPYLKTFAARLYTESGRKDTALLFLREMLKNTQDPRMRAQIIKRTQEIFQGKNLRSTKPSFAYQ